MMLVDIEDGDSATNLVTSMLPELPAPKRHRG